MSKYIVRDDEILEWLKITDDCLERLDKMDWRLISDIFLSLDYMKGQLEEIRK